MERIKRMKKLFVNEPTESSTATKEEPDAVSLRAGNAKVILVIQNLGCPYHRDPCDCDRYYARPGTAEWGC
jgi:hypothetical protein